MSERVTREMSVTVTSWTGHLLKSFTSLADVGRA
jgi:hypothetical protein